MSFSVRPSARKRPDISILNIIFVAFTKTAATPTSSWRITGGESPLEGSHHKSLVASGKFYDDLLKQNSMTYMGWDVYCWAVRQMQLQPELVKDESRLFLGSRPRLREIEDYLPTQRGRSLYGTNLELKEHQREALDALEAMRNCGETIALLCHATGTGKTVTAVLDAKRMGGRTQFLAHTQELVEQAAETFRALWPEAKVGRYLETVKEPDARAVCGSVQSVALHLDRFKDDEFNYLIIGEAQHAAADTYQKALAFFKPAFTLGLTATPERNDDRSILNIFKNTAHRLDIQTAVELGELVPVRCIRIHTNIDLTKVRFNSVRYNIRDLETKIYVPERNASSWTPGYNTHRGGGQWCSAPQSGMRRKLPRCSERPESPLLPYLAA